MVLEIEIKGNIENKQEESYKKKELWILIKKKFDPLDYYSTFGYCSASTLNLQLYYTSKVNKNNNNTVF